MSIRASDPVCDHFEFILNSLPDGVFITDTEGTTLRVNRMYEQLTGLRQQDIQGKNVRTLVEEGIFDRVLNPEIVKTGKPSTHVQKLSNGKRLVLSGIPVFDAAGHMCLVVTFVRDITMIARLNEQMDGQRQLIEQINEQIAYMANKESRAVEAVFASPAIEQVKKYLAHVAATDASILILGETGVGKDVFTRFTHSMSSRSNKIMLKVDCGGIAETLTESELFGYAPGAFTGASAKGKAGYFELADGGTIFLDEVGELPLSMQTKLLRVLQDGEIMRVGGNRPRKVDVRVIAATNRDLEECVKKGTFRSDLYYRLKVASIAIPSLRERVEDICPLAEHFLSQYCVKYHKTLAFMDATLEMLTRYSWPGNVRELQNMVHSLVITHHGSLISPRDLPANITGISPVNDKEYNDASLYAERPLKDIMADIEKDFLLRAIAVHGSIQKVAELFHVNRSTIFRKLSNHNDVLLTQSEEK
jgi:PAS domain S-box-containing protein